MRSLLYAAVVYGTSLLAASAQDAAPQPPPIPGNATMDATEMPQHLVKVLRTSNKAQTNRYFAKVYDFKNVNPYAVVRFYRRVMEIEEGAWYSFANEDMKSGKVLIICPEYQIPGLDAMMPLLDRPDLTSAGGDLRLLYQHQHRDSQDITFQQFIQLAGTPSNIITPDIQINGWYIEDSPSGSRAIQAELEKYDVPSPSLEAIVTVYEVSLNDDSQIGLDYVSWKNGPGRNLFAAGLYGQKEKVNDFNGSGANSNSLIYNSGKNPLAFGDHEWEAGGDNIAYLYDLPSAYFDYLAGEGHARVLTKAKLVAGNRATAILEIGDEILYYKVNHLPDLRGGARIKPLDPYGDLEQVKDTSATGEITDTLSVKVADYPDNRTVVPTLAPRTLGDVKTGFTLTYSPIINKKGATLVFTMSMVDLTGFQDDGTPVLSSRSIDTTFKVPHDRREITIGSMVRTNDVASANQMPWLGDIPVLGYLFGGSSKIQHKTMVLATVSTRVLEGETNYTDEEEAAKEKALGAPAPTPENSTGFRPNGS